MKGKTLLASLAFALALLLGSCSSFSDFLADHWPHIAGGEPVGLPPRPGAPGYAQFIAGQAGQDPDSAVASQARPSVTAGKSVLSGQPLSATSQSSASAANKSETPDRNVVQGGLY